MLFKKSNIFRNIYFRSGSYLTFKSYHTKTFRIHRFPYSNILMASATAIGISVFVAYKNKMVCEVDPNIENQFNIITQHEYQEAIEKSRDILQRVKDEKGIPGLVVGVSIDGNKVWEEGFGFADVENRVLCSPDTVMRIASISKSITMAAVAKLWEQGKLDLDKPVQDYVPTFPQKHFNGKPVTITCRQLVSHLGGIRHYENGIKKDENGNKKKNEKDEMELKEYYLTTKHPDVKSALDMFKDDPLIENPGSKFLYSTHGWTLVSAVVEAAAKEPFTTHITKLFKLLGMKYTYLDENDVLIYNRSRNYARTNKGSLINSPYVDNSYKWAGGGFLSTVGDLMQFANAMLYSFQYKSNTHQSTNKNHASKDENRKIVISNNGNNSVSNITDNKLPGFLNNKTIEAMWQPIAPMYGMGWFVKAQKQECQFCERNEFCVFHTGGAIGASSVLFILPKNITNDECLKTETLPKGIVVALICNMQSVGLSQTAHRIAKEFDSVSLY